MNKLMVVVALGTAVGCTSDPGVAFTAVSQINVATNGVVVRDGAMADAAMAEQVCVLDVQAGRALFDSDLGVGTERLLDAYGDRTLAALGDEVATLPRDGGPVTESWAIDARDGRLIDNGVVLVSQADGCAVTFVEDTTASFRVPGLDCGGARAMAIDRRAGFVWLADGRSLARIDREGEFSRWDDVPADALSLDAAGGLVLGALGDDWLQTITADGEPVWNVVLDGPLVDLEVAPGSGMAGVVVGESRGRSRLALVDVATGIDVGDHPLPTEVDVAFSGDGHTRALMHPEGVLFYDVEVDRGALDLPDGPIGRGASGAAAGLGAGAVLGTALMIAVMAD